MLFQRVPFCCLACRFCLCSLSTLRHSNHCPRLTRGHRRYMDILHHSTLFQSNSPGMPFKGRKKGRGSRLPGATLPLESWLWAEDRRLTTPPQPAHPLPAPLLPLHLHHRLMKELSFSGASSFRLCGPVRGSDLSGVRVFIGIRGRGGAFIWGGCRWPPTDKFCGPRNRGSFCAATRPHQGPIVQVPEY